MTDSDHLDYRLRCHTKRTDLPADVLRDIGEAYYQITTLQRKVEDFKKGFEGSCSACEPVGTMNKQIREERDEARREICYSESADIAIKTGKIMGVEENAKAIAKERGWDCFDRCTHYCDSCGFLTTTATAHKVPTDDPTSSGYICNYCKSQTALDKLSELDEELGLN